MLARSKHGIATLRSVTLRVHSVVRWWVGVGPYAWPCQITCVYVHIIHRIMKFSTLFLCIVISTNVKRTTTAQEYTKRRRRRRWRIKMKKKNLFHARLMDREVYVHLEICYVAIGCMCIFCFIAARDARLKRRKHDFHYWIQPKPLALCRI